MLLLHVVKLGINQLDELLYLPIEQGFKILSDQIRM